MIQLKGLSSFKPYSKNIQIARLLLSFKETDMGPDASLKFFQDLAGNGLTMFDVIKAKTHIGNAGLSEHFLGKPFKEAGTPVEMALLTYRRQVTIEGIQHVIQQFKGKKTSFAVFLAEIGKWAKQIPEALTFSGDIDFSFVSNDVQLTWAMKQAFDRYISDRTKLVSTAFDSVCTAHGRATPDVYIGDHGKMYGDAAMKNGGLKLIDLDKGTVDSVAQDGNPIILHMILEQQAARHRAGLPELKAHLEPGLSMEMVRHFNHDIVAPKLFDPIDSILKASKYMDRSNAALKDIPGAAPSSPKLAEFTKEITKAAQTSNWNKIAELLKVHFRDSFGNDALKFETSASGGRMTADLEVNKKTIDAFFKRCTDAMWKNVQAGFEYKIKDLHTKIWNAEQTKLTLPELQALRGEMKQLVEMIKIEMEMAIDNHLKVPDSILKLNDQLKVMVDGFLKKQGARSLSDAEMKELEFIKELIKGNTPSLRSIAIAKVVQGIEKTNNLLDILDDTLLNDLRGQNPEFDDFVNTIKDIQAEAASKRWGKRWGAAEARFNKAKLAVIKTKGYKVVQSANRQLNDMLNKTATRKGAMKAMMAVNLAQEIPAYYNAWNREGYVGLASEFFRRRVPAGAAIDAWYQENYFRVGFEIVYTIFPPTAIPEALYGMASQAAGWAGGKMDKWNYDQMVFDLFKGAKFELKGKAYLLKAITYRCYTYQSATFKTRKNILALPKNCPRAYRFILPQIKNHPLIYNLQEILTDPKFSNGPKGSFPYTYDTSGSKYGKKIYDLYLRKVDEVVLEYFKGVVERLESTKKWSVGTAYADIIRIERELSCDKPLVSYTVSALFGEDIMGDAERFQKIVNNYNSLKTNNEAILKIKHAWAYDRPEEEKKALPLGNKQKNTSYNWGKAYIPSCDPDSIQTKSVLVKRDLNAYKQALQTAVADVNKIVGAGYCQKQVESIEFCRNKVYAPTTRAALCKAYYKDRNQYAYERCRDQYKNELKKLETVRTPLSIDTSSVPKIACVGRETELRITFDRDCPECKVTWTIQGYLTEKVRVKNQTTVIWKPKFSGKSTVHVTVQDKANGEEILSKEMQIEVKPKTECPDLRLLIKSNRTEIEENEELILHAVPESPETMRDKIEKYTWFENGVEQTEVQGQNYHFSGLGKRGQTIELGVRAKTASTWTEMSYFKLKVKSEVSDELHLEILPTEKNILVVGKPFTFSTNIHRRVDSGLFRYQWTIFINDHIVESLDNNRANTFTLQTLSLKEKDKVRVVVYVQDTDNNPKSKRYGQLIREGRAEKTLVVYPSDKLDIVFGTVPFSITDEENLDVCVVKPVAAPGEPQNTYRYEWYAWESGSWRVNNTSRCGRISGPGLAGQTVKLKVRVTDIYNRTIERETPDVKILEAPEYYLTIDRQGQGTVEMGNSISLQAIPSESLKALSDLRIKWLLNGAPLSEGESLDFVADKEGVYHLQAVVWGTQGIQNNQLATAKIVVTYTKKETPKPDKQVDKSDDEASNTSSLNIPSDSIPTSGSSAVNAPAKVTAGTPFMVSVTPSPELKGKVKHYSWSGPINRGPMTLEEMNKYKYDPEKMEMLIHPRNAFPDEYNIKNGKTAYISVDLLDAAGDELDESSLEVPVQLVILGAEVPSTWEGGSNFKGFGAKTSGGEGWQQYHAWVHLHWMSDGDTTPDSFDEPVTLGDFTGLGKKKSVGFKSGGYGSGYIASESKYELHAVLKKGRMKLKVAVYAGASGYWDNRNKGWVMAKATALFSEAMALAEAAAHLIPYGSKLPTIDVSKFTVKTPESTSPLKLSLNGPRHPISVGQKIVIQAIVDGGSAPYSYKWSGPIIGSGDKVKFKSNDPGVLTVSLSVTDKDGNVVSASTKITVQLLEFEVTGLPDKPVYASTANLSVRVKGGAKGSIKPIWQASEPGIKFNPPEGMNTTITFGRMGRIAVWAQIPQAKGAKTLEAKQVFTEVVSPVFTLSINPKAPRVGQEVRAKITSLPNLPADTINWAWSSPVSSNRMEYNDSASEIGFTLKDTKQLKLHSEARVPFYMDVIGSVKAQIQAQKYTINVSAKKFGPPVKTWDPVKKAPVTVGVNTYLTGQEFKLIAALEGSPKPGTINWKWKVNEGVTISNANSQTPTISRSRAGSVTAEVTATDQNKVILGTGLINLTVTEPVSTPVDTSVKDAKELLKQSRNQWTNGDLDKAISTLKQEKQIAPKNKKIIRTIKSMVLQKKMLDEKLDKTARLIEAGKFKEAEKMLSQAAYINNKYLPYINMVEQLSKKRKKTGQKKKRQKQQKNLVKQARNQWKEGELDKAITTLHKAKILDPKNKEVANTLKGMEFQKKNLDEKLHKTARQIKEGKYKEAKRSLSGTAIISKKYPPYIEMVKTLTKSRKNEEEKKKSQNQAKTLVAIANDLEKKGKLKAALDKLRQAQKLNPGSNLDSRIAEIERRLSLPKPKPEPNVSSAESGWIDDRFYPVDLSPVGGKKGKPRQIKTVMLDDSSWIRLKSTDEKRLSIRIPVSPPQQAQSIAMVSNLDDATYLEQGAVIARMTVLTATGETSFDMKAGVHSSEWNYDSVNPKHNRVHDKEAGKGRAMSIFKLSTPQKITAIRFDYVETNAQKWFGHAPGFCIEGVTLIRSSQGITDSYVTSNITKNPSAKSKTENVGNVGGVANGPRKPTTYRFDEPVKLLFLGTYHWNHGKGKSPPGKIGLRHNDGTLYGPWQTRGRAGQGGVPDAYWEVNPNVPLKPGTYTVVDSDPKTWATNAQEGWKGFATIRTAPVDYPDELPEGVTTPTSQTQTTLTPDGYPSIAGLWNEKSGSTQHVVRIEQNGNQFTASCTYKLGSRSISWKQTGTIDHSGKIISQLQHLDIPESSRGYRQQREMQLSKDGNTLEGYSSFEGGGHSLYWTRVSGQKKGIIIKDAPLPQGSRPDKKTSGVRTPSQTKKTKVEQVFSFNGLGDVVKVPDDPSLRAAHKFSISFWAHFNKIPRTGNYNDSLTIVEKDKDYILYWRADTGVLELSFTDACGKLYHIGANTILSGLRAGKWHQFKVTAVNPVGKNKAEFHFYMDGIEQPVSPNVNRPSVKCGWFTGKTGALYIGSRSPSNSARLPFSGRIKELKILNRALEPNEF